MARQRNGTLGGFARAGFQQLAYARTELNRLVASLGLPDAEALLGHLSEAADPDAALAAMNRVAENAADVLRRLDDQGWCRLSRVLGASPALGAFLTRHPEHIEVLTSNDGVLPSADEARVALLASVADASTYSEPGWNRLRVTYRAILTSIMLYDLSAPNGSRAALEDVARALSDLADAALEAALVLARKALVHGGSVPPIPQERVDAVRLAVIAMGKSGAEELNVVSDVDVLFVYEGDERVAAQLARELMRAIHDPSTELPLWQIDANLRPEGRHGPLVRTLPSMLGYYERWAKTWEFQALMKARPCAGDLELGRSFVAAVQPLVWASSGREDFVGSVQRMRERVAEQIPLNDADSHLKLGPGGLRDIEFSVQLLQLVHGGRNPALRVPGTLPALRALAEGGYVARADAERLREHYCTLRVLEHRLQLRYLRRTAIMPSDENDLRILARATGFAGTAHDLTELWQQTRLEVRRLHLKIFYAPLLAAVAALPQQEATIGSDEAAARLASIGFRDPRGAIRHLTALTAGSTRSTNILRTLLPVLLQWIGEGTDPDYGLVAFRRITEANEQASWYLRLLRDGSLAAERLAHLLANARFAAELLETQPEGVAWLEDDDLLRPPHAAEIHTEMMALVARHLDVSTAADRVRRVHRREILRLALGRLTGVLTERDVARGLDSAHTALLDALLHAIGTAYTSETGIPAPEIALIGMGRFGGGELGFASDIDLMAVSRDAHPDALRLVAELRTLVSDPRFPVDLDFDLRPEGKNGPLVRSLESYESYYDRWAVTWEAQALLRARHAAGSEQLSCDFLAVAAPVRYPDALSDEQLRDIRGMKARIESERLPRGADPAMHLKLGPGGLSDVEWLVQLIQLRHGAVHPRLQTVSTLEALDTAVDLGILTRHDAGALRASWTFASTARSALKLWNGRTSDILPSDWRDLSGIAGVLGERRDRTAEYVERWRSLSRRARRVVEREFFGYRDDDFFTP